LEDPFNRYYRYPLARLLVRVLVKTPVTPNQVTLVQPFLAALAGWCVTFDDARHLLLAALLFEVRSILDCADGTLARAKNMMSPAGHAIDAMADWIGVILLYAGIFQHFRLHPPPDGPWSAYVSTTGLLCVVLFHAALRSFASDYFKLKYTSIFEKGHDETVESLRRKVLALGDRPTFFARVDVFIGKAGHLFFERERFHPERSRCSTSNAQIAQLLREERSPRTRLIGGLWALSNGDAFLSLVVISLLLNQLWLGQLLFATVGVAWIYGVLLLNALFLRGASKRARLATA
ncbi:MAG: CDP-alcohol phosphatidyltransferase family protein, partial [Minicystis sp.]